MVWLRSLIGLLTVCVALSASAAEQVYSFGVLSQRSAVLTAEYWNPILAYVGRRAGVGLELKIARTAPDSNVAIAKGGYDFVYSNTIFVPALATQNYQVILRPRVADIASQIVTLEDSPIRSLADLAGKVVGFPSRAAFVGYAVPMDHLLRERIAVTPTFGGNQEGIMGQLMAGKVIAAGVNSQVMRNFAAREGMRYRVLWESESYHNLPVARHPRVPEVVAEAVQQAFAGMPEDPEGAKVLEASAQVIKQKPPYGFIAASQQDYQNYVDFYRNTVVTDIQ